MELLITQIHIILGNSQNYYLSSTDNDKPDQGFENTIISGVGTGFEQYKNILPMWIGVQVMMI